MRLRKGCSEKRRSGKGANRETEKGRERGWQVEQWGCLNFRYICQENVSLCGFTAYNCSAFEDK